MTLVQIPVENESDIVVARKQVQQISELLGIALTPRTKLVTAVSELARNMLKYGGGGEVTITKAAIQDKTGLTVTFVDDGPGIVDIAQVMQDGYTTGRGLGLGLPASKRLVDVFEITSRPGEGTRVAITMWKR